MSGSPVPDLVATQPSGENMKLNQTTQIVIENGSDDITISKCEQDPPSAEIAAGMVPSAVPLKAQVLPLVYVGKNNNSKFPFVINPAKKPGGNNFILSPAPPLVSTKSIPSPISTPQNVVLAGRGRPLMMPKQPIILPQRIPQGNKMTGTYVTMLKPVPKPEMKVTLQSDVTTTEVTREMPVLKPQSSVRLHHPEGVTQPQKFILTGPIPKITKNKLIAPMPKLQAIRQPVTATTNCLQPSKFTVLPLSSVPPKEPVAVSTHQKVFNFQISDGKIFSNASAPVTIMCDSKNGPKRSPSEGIMCDNSDVVNNSYELSIAEEESLSNQSEPKLTADCNPSSNKPVKFAHGVSILKKNFLSNLLSEIKKPEGCVTSAKSTTSHDKITNSSNSGVTATHLTVKASSSSNAIEEKVAATVEVKKPEKEKSRRKAQFSFRKDFSDMEIISFPDDDDDDDDDSKLMIKSPETEEVDIKDDDDIKDDELIKQEEVDLDQKPDMEDYKLDRQPEQRTESALDPRTLLDIKTSEQDTVKLLQWENNIGSLPRSHLRFLLNEFGIIEFLPGTDQLKMSEKKLKKAKEKEDLERDVRCIQCGCYGILADFVDSDFCSVDCQSNCKLKPKRESERDALDFDILRLLAGAVNKSGKRNKLVVKTTSFNDFKVNHANNDLSEEEDTSNDASKDKFTYPWACKKKGFSWSKYLMHISAIAAPVKLFKDPFPYTRNLFRPGMKLEGVDPQHPSYFCVFTVADTIGYRVRLHFDGYSQSYDFWTYADSLDMFPMGWCEKYGHVLRPPPGYTEETFNWLQYLRETKSTAAPKQLFVNRAGQAICPNGFRIGMKLEAVDKKNSSLICVATVRDMMDNRILVHFDGWDDIYDYWADPTSPYIHPVGWCDQYGHDLTAPSDYPTPETFTWEKYLKETKSVAAPVRAFKQRPACGFKRGMRLECVDKRVPHLIRVATVDDVKEHQIRIHFDGWPDRYSYWVDDDSTDIHPIGWCQKTGHPLEPPLTPDDVFQFVDCPTVGCRGEGHIEGMKYTRHSTSQACPYAEPHIDMDKVLPDRLLSPSWSPEAKEPVSRQPRSKPKLGRPSKWMKVLSRGRRERSDEPPEKLRRKPYNKHLANDQNGSVTSGEEKALSFIESSKILPAERESWRQHSRFLNDFIATNGGSEDPKRWTPSDVLQFIRSIPGCVVNGVDFMEHGIDGEAFLQLSQTDIVHILKIKMGPAVKVYNSVVLLRERFGDKKS